MSLTITLQPSGRSFSVDRDETILAAAIRHGPYRFTSIAPCTTVRSGVLGRCIVSK